MSEPTTSASGKSCGRWMAICCAPTSACLAAARRSDDGVFSRDLIDLAMMEAPLPLLSQAVSKAEGAYGPAILRDLDKALNRLMSRTGWLERCMQVMDMKMPRALLWQKLRRLQKIIPQAS